MNHSNTFVDHVSGVNTNTIEGTWSHLKRFVRARVGTRRQAMDFLLQEFCWRRRCKFLEISPYHGLIIAISTFQSEFIVNGLDQISLRADLDGDDVHMLLHDQILLPPSENEIL